MALKYMAQVGFYHKPAPMLDKHVHYKYIHVKDTGHL